MNAKVRLVFLALLFMGLVAFSRLLPLPAAAGKLGDLAWQTSAHPLPQPLTGLGLTVIWGRGTVASARLLAVGGRNTSGGAASEVYSSSLGLTGQLDDWTASGRLDGPRAMHGAIVYGDQLYVFGGHDGNTILRSVRRAVVDTAGRVGVWQRAPDLPIPLYLFGSTQYNGWLYLAGGWDGNSARAEVYFARVLPDGDLSTWTATGSLPRPLVGLSLTAANGYLYAVGGAEVSAPSARVYRAAIAGDGTLAAWEELAALPAPRAYHAAALFRGRLVVLGGLAGTTPNSSTATVYAALLDPDGSLGGWSVEPSLPKPLDRHAAAVTDLPGRGQEVLYVAGGRSNNVYQDAVYCLGCSYRSYLPLWLRQPTPTATPTATDTATPTATLTPTWTPIPTFCDDVSEIPRAECEALVALYNGTNGSAWTNNTGWLVTNTPCSWYGVSCASGHVTQLYLRYNQLSGSIPPELSNLANLLWLDLYGNRLSGGIPPQLGNLASLQYLDLSINQLSGGIPSQLSNPAKLGFLWLSNNQLSDSIPSELGNLANLQSLWLHNNQLGGSIPSELGNLANLRDLSLYNNQLAGSIPAELGNLANLQSLYLFNNQLSGGIPSTLSNLANLQGLHLDDNQLSGGIPPELGNLVNLQSLHLSWNGLSGEIPPELGSLANLRDLWLHNNQLSGSIPPKLGTLAKLQDLYLSDNQLSGSIPSELGNMANLRDLWLSDNQLSGNISSELGNLVNLESLDLSENELSGSIPAELGSLANLQSLWLSRNQLSGGIPSQLGNLANLQFLLLNNNQLSGSIPSQLGNLANLQTLWLNNNQLSGSIPPELGNLANLQYLYLYDNQLSGSIPSELCNPPNLQSLDLGYNKLTTAPACIDSKDPDWAQTQTVAPTNLQATAQSGDSVQLTWTPILYTGDGGYYEVSYATVSGGPYAVHGTTANKSAAGYLVGGLSPGITYYFRVRAYTPAHGSQQNDLWSDYTQEVSAAPWTSTPTTTSTPTATNTPTLTSTSTVTSTSTPTPTPTATPNLVTQRGFIRWYFVTLCESPYVLEDNGVSLAHLESSSIPLQWYVGAYVEVTGPAGQCIEGGLLIEVWSLIVLSSPPTATPTQLFITW